MNKLNANILIIVALLFSSVNSVSAQSISGPSATLKGSGEDSGFDYRVENLTNFLEKYDSPLSAYAESFVAYADLNGLDYRLVPAIAGVESTFGKNTPSNSFNAYGWANGNCRFTSWTDSIAQVSETLKKGYIDKGALTIARIAKRYAPPSTTWGSKVKYFISKIDALPLSFDI